MIKLGANSVLFAGFDLETAFKYTACAGYDGIELSAIKGMCEHLDLDNWQTQKNEIKELKEEITEIHEGHAKEIERAEALIEANVDLLVIDTAHGHTKRVFDTLREIIKMKKNKTSICAGNIATAEAANFLIKGGADIVKIGIGPGSICTTRIVAGIGVPQLSAILNIKKKIKTKKISFISDGGIKFSGDLAKAFSAGADAVMIGSLFAGTDQAPGKIIKKNKILYKKFRGMGSIGAMSQGSADRYNQKSNLKKNKFVAEGVEGFIKYKGDVNKIIYQLIGGLKSSMGYLGCSSIKKLRKKPKFITITKAGFYESMVHNIDLVKD